MTKPTREEVRHQTEVLWEAFGVLLHNLGLAAKTYGEDKDKGAEYALNCALSHFEAIGVHDDVLRPLRHIWSKLVPRKGNTAPAKKAAQAVTLVEYVDLLIEAGIKPKDAHKLVSKRSDCELTVKQLKDLCKNVRAGRGAGAKFYNAAVPPELARLRAEALAEVKAVVAEARLPGRRRPHK
jgi:hypothetical protein